MNVSESLLICRTCLSTNKKSNMLPVQSVAQLIMSYTTVTITEDDGLPSEICGQCHLQAKQAYEFKSMCEYADKKLREGYHTVKELDSGLKEEELIIQDSDSSLRLPNETDTLENQSITVLDQQCKTEQVDFKEFSDLPNYETDISNSMYPNDNDDVSLSDYEDKHLNEDINCSGDERDNSIEANHKIKVENCNSNSNKEPFTCKYCNMTFIHRTRLVKHERQHEKRINCFICGKNYPTIKQLASHISIHNRKGAHLCPTCGKQFTMPENLIRHQRIHSGIRPYKCKSCDRSFVQSNELKSHMVTHTSEKFHLCSVCGNKYARQASLRIHVRRMHSNASSVRPFGCNICGHTFKDKRDLSQHNSIHRGERKHICKVCNKAFNRSSNLKVHERIHTGHRPFVCHICQRSFVQKHVLNTHLKVHQW